MFRTNSKGDLKLDLGRILRCTVFRSGRVRRWRKKEGTVPFLEQFNFFEAAHISALRCFKKRTPGDLLQGGLNEGYDNFLLVLICDISDLFKFVSGKHETEICRTSANDMNLCLKFGPGKECECWEEGSRQKSQNNEMQKTHQLHLVSSNAILSRVLEKTNALHLLISLLSFAVRTTSQRTPTNMDSSVKFVIRT